jgi:hypothetical protein
MKTKTIVVALILLLLASAAASLQLGFVSANPDGEPVQLAMPIEHVNYTITTVNGALWAQIDGEYPIYMQRQPNCVFNGEMPMVYPMPPGTTNIHVWLDSREVDWSNYTQAYPDAVHHTAIGDWWMIRALLENFSDLFTLKIHYEHPLQTVNGSYLFLYDLNISPYLSPQNSNSTAYFTVRMETNTTNLHAYTAPPDSVASDWKPITYTTSGTGSSEVVSIIMNSSYSMPLAGDLVLEFSGASQVPEFPIWAAPTVILALFLGTLLYVKRRTVTSRLRLSKTAI